MENPSRKPRAFAIGETKAKPKTKTAKKTAAKKPKAVAISKVKLDPVAPEAAARIGENLTPPPPTPQLRRFGWGSLFLASVTLLISLGIGLAIDQLIRDLFERHDWLGWAAAGLTALVAFAALMIFLRELVTLLRMRKIHHLHKEAEALHISGTLEDAKSFAGRVASLYNARADMVRAIREFSAHDNAVMGPDDYLEVTEKELLQPLDTRARREIMNSAQRVSVVTAVSPRAIVDIAYVLMENFRLIRTLSSLYGGRPGFVGLMRLARRVLTHLAATGAIAVGDGLIQQVIGHGVAARLSARLGEGVVNGLLTARIGIAAMDICRPMPFHALPRPGISDFLSTLVQRNKVKETAQ